MCTSRLSALGQVLKEGQPERVCVFSGHQTGQRGFRLSSLGALTRPLLPCPCTTSPHSKALLRTPHSSPAAQGDNNLDVLAPARRFSELRRARCTDLGGCGPRFLILTIVGSRLLHFCTANGIVVQRSVDYEPGLRFFIATTQ